MLNIALLLIFLLFIHSTFSQPSTGPPSLFEILLPVFAPVNNEAGEALLPTEIILKFQTPFIVRESLFIALSRWEITAACHPVALSYFGVRDIVNSSICGPLNFLIAFHFTFLRLNEVNFPQNAALHAAFLRDRASLDTEDRHEDLLSPIGFANMAAKRALNYFNNDGWNSMGDLSSDKFRMPFADYTGYRPVNLAEMPPENLHRPLRWQPLTKPADISPGEYLSQKHVVPFLTEVKSLVLTPEDIASRIPKSPYRSPNLRRKISTRDRAKLERLIENYFRISRKLTVKQRFKAWFWERKFVAFGLIPSFYTRKLRVDSFTQLFRFMGEVSAQHDAIKVAWTAKRRMDLVRPTTVIRRLWKGRVVKAFVGGDEGVQNVKAEEYEPLIAIQPHSEYPSASAILCRSILENMEITYRNELGNVTIPPFVLRVRGEAPGVPVKGNFTIRFKTLKDAILDCGKSRLWAGAHFPDAIREGYRLGKGIGQAAYDHMKALAEGRVPDYCPRCLK